MKIEIHRGLKEIGGNCIELRNSKSRILLDFGMPLMQPGGDEYDEKSLKNPSTENGVLPDVQGLYRWQEPEITAVILSHHHFDHVGLLSYIHPDIPVYLSKASLEILRIYPIFTQRFTFLRYDTNLQTFLPFEPFQVPGFEITPLLTDHSAFDACSLVIQDLEIGSTVFYTGDLRKHGRKAKLIKKNTTKYKSKIDTLICEGTNLGQTHKSDSSASEEDCENQLVEAFEKQSLGFVLCAASNIDRLVSIYRACLRTKRTLVIDLFQLFMLEKLKKFSPGLPPHNDRQLKVFFLRGHLEALEKAGETEFIKVASCRRIYMNQITANPSRYCLRLPEFMAEKIAIKLSESGTKNITWIYSMWKGYLPDLKLWERAHKLIPGEQKYIHCSGHFHTQDLKDFIRELNPREVVPIHTLHPDCLSLTPQPQIFETPTQQSATPHRHPEQSPHHP